MLDKIKDNICNFEHWDLTDCNPLDVGKAIDALKPGLGSGPDGIPNLLIKHVKFEIIPVLTQLINCSIKTGKFPKNWKVGKVVPVKKRGNKSKMDNYRPVCLTSCLGKVVEHVVRNKFSSHLESILPDNMFGFRPHRSTQDVIVKLTDRIKHLKSLGLKVAAVALDATAAFDTLNHDLIISTLELIGVGPKMIAWTKNFMEDCFQYVEISGSKSDSWTSGIGVGQGRKFSPDLYNIGSLTASFWSNLSEAFLFADDGWNIVFGNTIAECNAKLQTVANDLACWFDLAGLTLNVSKSELIGFGFTPNTIHLDGKSIVPKESVNFLGTWIQSDLNFNQQLAELCNRIRSSAARIRCEGRHFDMQDKRLLYFGWVQGLLSSHSSTTLACLPETELYNIQIACNSAIRAVVGLPRFGKHSVSNIRKNLHIPSVINLRDRRLFEAAWMHFQSNFPSSSAGPLTRAKKNLILPHPVQKGFSGKMIATKLVLAWNKLPLIIKEEHCKTAAFEKIKKFVYNF